MERAVRLRKRDRSPVEKRAPPRSTVNADDVAVSTTARRATRTTAARGRSTAAADLATSPDALPVVTPTSALAAVATSISGVTTITSTLPNQSASAAAASAASSTSSKGLSTGATAAIIVVCACLAIGAIAFIAWRCFARRRAGNNGLFGSPMRENGPGIAYAGKSMTQRSSFGNNGNIPPIYAAHATQGKRRGSDERGLLGDASVGDMGANDYDHKSPERPAYSPVRDAAPIVSAAAMQQRAPPSQPVFVKSGPSASQTGASQTGKPVAASVAGSIYGAPAGVAAAGPFADSAAADDNVLYVVKRTFEPSLPDELVLFVGDKINIIQSFDDGWCLGTNLSGQEAQRGVFPRDCVEEADPKPSTGATLTRAPTLPPLNLANSNSDYFGPNAAKGAAAGAPAIQVSGPDGKHASAASVMLLSDDTDAENGILSSFPSAPKGAPVRRTSSLIADRDAELFVALGHALDGDKRQ